MALFRHSHCEDPFRYISNTFHSKTLLFSRAPLLSLYLQTLVLLVSCNEMIQNRLQKVFLFGTQFCSKTQFLSFFSSGSPGGAQVALGLSRVGPGSIFNRLGIASGSILAPILGSIAGRPIAFIIFLFHFRVDLGSLNHKII